MRNGKEFSTMIRNARQKRGYSLAELSQKIGQHGGGDSEESLSASYIHRLETGERSSPSVQVVATLAKALGIDMYDLINIGEDNREPRSLTSILFSNEVIIEEGGKALSSREKELIVGLIEEAVNLSTEGAMAKRLFKLIETAELLNEEIG